MRIRKKPRTIIAVDFDKTLVNNHYPFIENPNVELINFIKENRYKYTWILNTCREGKQLEYAVKYLEEEHGLKFDYVNQNAPWNIKEYGDRRKIYADYYIDSVAFTPEAFMRRFKNADDRIKETIRSAALWLDYALSERVESHEDKEKLQELSKMILEVLE